MCFIFGRNVAVLFATDNNLNKGWSKTIMATVKTYKFKFVTVQKKGSTMPPKINFIEQS